MTEDVGHVFQRRAIANHLSGGGVAEAVTAEASPLQTDSLQKLLDDPSGSAGMSKWLVGRVGGEKDFAIRSVRPLTFDVIGDQRSHFGGQG